MYGAASLPSTRDKLKEMFLSHATPAHYSEQRFGTFCDLFVFIVIGDWGLAQLLRSHLWAEPKTQIAFFALILGLVYLLKKDRRRLILCGLFLLGVMLSVFEFPNTPNHRLLEIVVLGVACMTNTKSELERQILFSFIRSFALLAFLYAGIQKVLLGTYFYGEYLAYKTYSSEQFLRLSPLWTSAIEREMFKSLPWPPHAGLGPFHLSTWRGLLASNAVWILEIVLPIGCFFGRKRNYWATAIIIFVIGIQLMALEVEFVLLMLALLSLFFNTVRDRQILYVSGVLLFLSAILL
jgi:hypothetical protein